MPVRAERRKWFRLDGRRFIAAYNAHGSVQMLYERVLTGKEGDASYLRFWSDKTIWHFRQTRPKRGLLAELLALAEKSGKDD